MAHKRNVADASMLCDRLDEEKIQLLKEIKASVVYYREHSASLQRKIDVTREQIQNNDYPSLQGMQKRFV